METRISSENETESLETVLKEMHIFKCRNLKTNKLEDCTVIQQYLANRIESARNREVAILKERLRIAHEALEKIVEMTAESETAIIAGNADNRLTCDDHAFKYLFYPKGENDAH